MNVSADNRELLKYIKIWDMIEDLLNKKHSKKVLYNNTIYNVCIKTKISLYNENFHGNKKLIKGKYYGNPKSICEVKNKYYPQTFLDAFFETHSDNNINSLFKELVRIIDWSDDESNN